MMKPRHKFNKCFNGRLTLSYTLSHPFRPYFRRACTFNVPVSVQCFLRTLCVCSSVLEIPIIQKFNIINFINRNIMFFNSSSDENCISCNCVAGQKVVQKTLCFRAKIPRCRLTRRTIPGASITILAQSTALGSPSLGRKTASAGRFPTAKS